MAISKRLRYEILRRDQNTCNYCGGKAPDVTLTVDHVLPVTLGGSDDANNLVAACKDCNAGKTSSSPDAPLVAQVDERAATYAAALHSVIEKRAAKFAADSEHLAWFDRTWNAWTDPEGHTIDRDGSWRNSVTRFMGAGLSRDFIGHAVEIALGSRRIRNVDGWRYFCGICHKEIKSITEEAAGLAAASDSPPADQSKEMPKGPGLDYRFDALNLSEHFIVDLLEHIGTPDPVLKLATQGYWSAMEKAYKFFLADPDRYFEDDEEDVNEEFSSCSAWYMHHIQQACRGELVPDGS